MHLIAVFLILLVTRALGSGLKEIQGASWVEVHSDTEEGAPSPVRGEFSAVSWKGDIFVYGGCDIRFVNWMNDTWVFPVSSNTTAPAYRLDTTGRAPPGTCGHGSVVLKDRMYVFGGNGPDGASDSLHYLDLKSNHWTEVKKSASSVWPPSRALVQHAMTLSSNKEEFVVVSGTSNDDHDDDSAFVFSAQNEQWRKISHGLNGHTNVGGSAALMFEDKLFVMGGFAESDVLPDFLAVDTSKDQQFQTVKTVGDTPGPLAFQGAVAVGQYMVLYGGFSMQGINGDVWAWDMSKDSPTSWCKLEVGARRPLPHFAGGWVVIDDSIYAFGGRINPTGYREKLTSDLWRLENVKSALASCGH